MPSKKPYGRTQSSIILLPNLRRATRRSRLIKTTTTTQGLQCAPRSTQVFSNDSFRLFRPSPSLSPGPYGSSYSTLPWLTPPTHIKTRTSSFPSSVSSVTAATNVDPKRIRTSLRRNKTLIRVVPLLRLFSTCHIPISPSRSTKALTLTLTATGCTIRTKKIAAP